MQRFGQMLVGLVCGPADAGLIRYAAAVVRLGTVHEVRFVHILPTPADPATAHDHDGVLAKIQDSVAANLGPLPAGVRVTCEVLKGPLVDRLLSYTAEQEIDLILVGHARGHEGRRSLARRLA